MSYILPEVESNESEFITIKRTRKKRDYVDEKNTPATPFHKLRQDLRVTQAEWSKICGIALTSLYKIERGENLPSLPLAKRMQEEAWRRGVAVTLDELFQNVEAKRD
jgi:DNA-binding XRE family transcriptional regulator